MAFYFGLKQKSTFTSDIASNLCGFLLKRVQVSRARQKNQPSIFDVLCMGSEMGPNSS